MGIAQQDWQERRKKIADTIKSLGDSYSTALCNGWLAYIQEMYGAPTTTQQGALKCNLASMIVDDDAAMWHCLHCLRGLQAQLETVAANYHLIMTENVVYPA